MGVKSDLESASSMQLISQDHKIFNSATKQNFTDKDFPFFVNICDFGFEVIGMLTMKSSNFWEVKLCIPVEVLRIGRAADKSLAFLISLFAAQPKEFFLDGLKKLEQGSHKCVELRGEYVE
jgi:hypothetical protein